MTKLHEVGALTSMPMPGMIDGDGPDSEDGADASTDAPSTGHKWRVQLISEGPGSSGYYSGDMLKRDGAAAFPAGTHIYADHLTESEMWDRAGSHSIKDLVGVTLTEAQFNTNPTPNLQADVRWFDPEFESFIVAAQKDIALSIEASGTVTEGNVDALEPSPFNAVAVVPRGGRDGKILTMIESYRENHGTISPESIGRKDMAVTPEDIKKVAEAIVAGLAPTLNDLKEALKPAAPAPVVVEEDDAVDVAAVAEAVAASGLPKTARAKVYAAVEAGTKVEDAIAEQNAFITELKESLAAAATEDGRVIEGADSADVYTVSGW